MKWKYIRLGCLNLERSSIKMYGIMAVGKLIFIELCAQTTTSNRTATQNENQVHKRPTGNFVCLCTFSKIHIEHKLATQTFNQSLFYSVWFSIQFFSTGRQKRRRKRKPRENLRMRILLSGVCLESNNVNGIYSLTLWCFSLKDKLVFAFLRIAI